MNNSREAFAENINWLYEHDPIRFKFIDTLINSAINKMEVSISIKLNSGKYKVKVYMPNYVHYEEFEDNEKAIKVINMVRELVEIMKG